MACRLFGAKALPKNADLLSIPQSAGDRFTKKVSSLWKWANFSNFITFCKLAHLFGELKVFH